MSESKVGAVRNTVSKRYKTQRHRGTDGFAFVSADDEARVIGVERASEEKDILAKLQESLSRRVLFHHRFPTSTANIPSATHPIVVDNELLDKKYYVVHNGVISNDDEQKTRYEKMGFRYTTVVRNAIAYVGIDDVLYWGEETSEYNDSESLAIDLALFLEGKKEKIESTGSIAFIVWQCSKDGKLERVYFGRNEGNPLVIEENKDIFCIKSEGTGKSIDVDTLYWYDVGGERVINSKPCAIGFYFKRYVGVIPKTLGIGSPRDDYYDDYYRYHNNEHGYPSGSYTREDGTKVLWEGDELTARMATMESDEKIQTLWGDLEIIDAELHAIRADIALAQEDGTDTTILYEQEEQLIDEKDDIEQEIMAMESSGCF